MTMMYHANRAANIRPLLTNGSLPDELSALQPAFDKAFEAESRGTRLKDILGLGGSARLQVKEFSSTGFMISGEEIHLLQSYTGRQSIEGKDRLLMS